MRKPSRFSLALLLAALLVPLSAHAGPAKDLVKKQQEQLFTVVGQPKSDARDAKLRGLFDKMLAYDVFARRSLGNAWSKQSPADLERFSGLLTQLVRNNYKRNLSKMLDYDIEYVGEKKDGDSTWVLTRATLKPQHRSGANDAVPIEIDFEIMNIAGEPKVVDIRTERASLVRTYRTQFSRIEKKGGFSAVLAKLQAKLDKGDG